MAVGWGSTPTEPSFGASNDQASVKSKLVNLISSVRTLMRSRCLASPQASFWPFKDVFALIELLLQYR